MNLQPLYDVKERLEYAAIAGVSLLGEDFRLQRAVEGLKPLAAASPVFGKIDAGLAKLLSAQPGQRPGLLLDVLALVDAVAYTQAKTGVAGELEPLPAGGGTYHQISYGQMNPLMVALTTTGGGRMEIVKSAWENHPGFFEDYRVLPALVGGLGDSYGEMAELCAELLKKLGLCALPELKKDFDPAGPRAMARRVEVISAIEGTGATPWLRGILDHTKKDVRVAVISALGGDGENTPLLLNLAKYERGKNLDAALEALAKQDGEEVAAYWEEKLRKDHQSVQFLNDARTDWASDLVAKGLWEMMERLLAGERRVSREINAMIWLWWTAAKGKSSSAMLDLWRWTDAKMADINQLQNHIGQPLELGAKIVGLLLDNLCQTGPGPLSGLCLELWGRRRKETRYLPHAVVASLMTRPAAEVYDEFAPYVLTSKPLIGGEQKRAFHNAVLAGLARSRWNDAACRHEVGAGWPTAQPLDERWVGRLTHAVWKTTGQKTPTGYGGDIEEYDRILMGLLDPGNQENRQLVVDHLREQVAAGRCMYKYCCDIFQLGGDPVGVLGCAMQKHSNTIFLSHVVELLAQAQERLPPARVLQMAKELFVVKAYQPGNQEFVKKVYPHIIATLETGGPVPSFETLRTMVLKGGI